MFTGDCWICTFLLFKILNRFKQLPEGVKILYQTVENYVHVIYKFCTLVWRILYSFFCNDIVTVWPATDQVSIKSTVIQIPHKVMQSNMINVWYSCWFSNYFLAPLLLAAGGAYSIGNLLMSVCMSVCCHQTFSNRYSYSFCPIVTKVGTHDITACTVVEAVV